MSQYIVLDGGRTLSMHGAKIGRSSVGVLSCYASLALGLAGVKIRRIVVFIEARNSLERAINIRWLGSIRIILALRRL